MSLSDDIKDFALNLGYSRAGITTADPFPNWVAEINSRIEMYDWYTSESFQPLRGAAPREVWPAAKSIVVLAYDIHKEAFPEQFLHKIGRFYLSRSYMAPTTSIAGARRDLMRQFLEKNGCHVADSFMIPERLAAARAGVVTYGKNTFTFADGIGSFILITPFVVDVELDYDQPTMELKCPPDCDLCIKACPTGALYEPLKMDPRRCIAYHTFVTRDRVTGTMTHIAPEIRERMGTWIHGCDLCQEVCPRNQKKLKANLPPNEYLSRLAADFDLAKVLNLTDEYYGRMVRPLMYNYIRDRRYFQRNAAIAIGNMRDPAVIPTLAQALHGPDEFVHGYIAWALGRTGGPHARQLLETALLRETSATAKQEIEAALAAV